MLVPLPALDGAAPEVLLVGLDHVDPDRVLELEDEAGPDRLDDGRRAALLAHDGIVEVAVLARSDEGDRAATDDVRHPIRQKSPPHGEDTGRAGAADELVRAEEDGVLRREWVLRADRVHLDLHVRRRCREVPERERAVTVQEIGDRAGVREDPRHVRRGGERADLERSRLVADELGLERREVDVAVLVLRDHDDVGDRLPPRQLVGVVLEGADEDHRPLLRRNVGGQRVAVLERRREPQAEDSDQLVDRPRRPRAAEDHAGLVVAADRVVDDPPRVLSQPGCLPARAGGLRVGVRVARQNLVADHVLDERERPPARRVVRVGHAPGAERAPHHLVVADHRLPDALQERAVGWLGSPGQGSVPGAHHTRLVGERYRLGAVAQTTSLEPCSAAACAAGPPRRGCGSTRRRARSGAAPASGSSRAGAPSRPGRGSRGWRSHRPARRSRARGGLAVAELPGCGGLGDVVDPGAAAADVLLGGLDHRQAGNPPQRDRRRERQPLGVAEMARVLHRHLQVQRVAGRARLDAGEELAEIAHSRRERRRALGPGGVVAEHVAELLQVRAAARRVDDHGLDALERLDHPARERPPLVAAAGVHREGAAAALRRRHDLVAVGCEHPRRGRVDRSEHHGLHATCENADTPAGLATRGRDSFAASRSSARAARSRSSRRGGPGAAACGRAARAAAPAPSGGDRGAA